MSEAMRRFTMSGIALFLKNASFTVVVPGMVAVYVPLTMIGAVPEDLLDGWTVGRIVGLVPLTAGAILYFWCLWDFAAYGRGTPAPFDAPRRLVVRGPYRWVRNPMYLGVELVILGWSALFHSIALVFYAIIVGLVFHGSVVLYEEPALRRRFGAGYRKYCEQVGRWLPARNQVTGNRNR
jgi:protein-S-isoprenylcysteine O-methyltransferase Ste14